MSEQPIPSPEDRQLSLPQRREKLRHLVKEHGIEMLNTGLYLAHQSLSKDATNLESAATISEILEDAIYSIPDIATSITLTIRPDIEHVLEERKGVNKGTHAHVFPWLLPDIRSITPDGSIGLTLPLPFAFNVGTHGSGDRKARLSSCEEISLLKTHGDKDSKPHFGYGITFRPSRMFSSPDDIIFLPSDIEQISFSNDTNLTPYFDYHQNKSNPLERMHPYKHYLNFRGFSIPMMQSPRLPRNLKVWVPQRTTSKLWTSTEKRRGLFMSPYLTKGFLAFAHDNNDLTVQELTDVFTGNEDKDVETLAHNVLVNKTPSQKWTNLEAISRLQAFQEDRVF